MDINFLFLQRFPFSLHFANQCFVCECVSKLLPRKKLTNPSPLTHEESSLMKAAVTRVMCEGERRVEVELLLLLSCDQKF